MRYSAFDDSWGKDSFITLCSLSVNIIVTREHNVLSAFRSKVIFAVSAL